MVVLFAGLISNANIGAASNISTIAETKILDIFLPCIMPMTWQLYNLWTNLLWYFEMNAQLIPYCPLKQVSHARARAVLNGSDL
jgi:hypothetical protein